MEGRSGDNLSHTGDTPSWWRTRTGLVFLGFVVIAGYFLITEHRAHLVLAIPYLPWLLLLACPFMHLFMHHGHGGHGGGEGGLDQAKGCGGTDHTALEDRP